MNDPAPSSDRPHDATAMLPGTVRRHATLWLVVGLGLALFGFLRGIQAPPPMLPASTEVKATESNVAGAVNYSELPTARIRPNADWSSNLATLKSDRPGPFDPVVRTEEMKLTALADRARNRAYDGAPPTIPHGSKGMATAACLACHGDGIRVGDRIATKLSHPPFTNCTQCHVDAAPPELQPFADTPGESAFVGAYRAGPGSRAGPGAPPTIPHTTWMRSDCTSCHGLVTRPGLRTTHPWLRNCTQCHAPSAALDQVDFTREKP